MPLDKVRVYEIEVTGHLTIQALNDNKALDAARAYIADNPKWLGLTLTAHDGFEWVEPPPVP